MFSGSNSYLGGANSGRPGQPQYGQQQQQQFQGQPQYGAQQPGYAQQAPLQQQFTGYPAGGLQPQATGYPPQQQPQQFQQQQPQYGGFQQPQPTGFQQQQPTAFQQPQPTGFSQQPQSNGFATGQQTSIQPPAPQQKPQPTGMTSSDMANSFRSSAPQPQQPATVAKAGSKIPNIRLSFITAQDQAKFEQLFKSATGGDQALSGEKAKDLLIRSKLDGNSLAQIWTLSDTTKSGQLLFPEFALAMYLCNLRLTGKEMPTSLPEKVRNEVSSMVDIISFGVPDDGPQQASRTNAPNFNESPQIQQPQAQNPSNQQLLSALTAQPTGFQVPQATGFQQPMQPQQTGYPSGIPQATGYTGPRPPMPPMPTGFNQMQGLSPQQTGFGGGGGGAPMTAPLNAQPTGRPGQWGLVNAPATGLPNLSALQQQMMPQPGRETGYTTHGLRGNATVPWAVTKDEKKIYDDMFKAWDGFGKGYITGNQAIEIFGQSGLEKSELERIWTLSDPHNKGRLNLDEFAVSMHLIYRRLNGYPVPNQLPAELIPPSTRHLNDSIGTMKNLLSQDAQERKSTGAFLQPQKTGVSYLKSHSFRANGASDQTRKDATVFKNNDDDIGYRSSARRRVGQDGARSSSPALSDTSSMNADEMSIEQLKKTIREKQVLLDAMDFEDENKADEEDALDRKDRKESEDLFRRIRRIQEDVDGHPGSAFRTGDSDAERRSLQRQLRGLQDRLPELASHVRRCERAIAEAQLELFRLKDAKANPGSAAAIVGTGPGGAVTESDRLKARAKAMMQQRSAALSGKKVESADDGSAAARRLEEENKRVTREREDHEKMVRDVEESVTEYSKGLESSLKEGSESASDEHERRRWEDGLGVEDEVKDFIFDLQRSSRSARVRNEEKSQPRSRAAGLAEEDSRASTPLSRTDSPASSKPSVSTPQTTGSSYASYKTAEERAAFIKQQAEQRMAERLAALGLKTPAKSGESAAQRAERERKERDDRLRAAEAEDARREQERRARLDGESIAPPSPAAAGNKAKPPPPAPRKNRSESLQSSDNNQWQAENKRAEQQIKEQALKEQEVAMAEETKNMEDEEARQERELQKQREDAAASLRALEEQVKAGKVKKAEEKKRREAAKKDNQEREARLAAQRAEIEAAKERERQLRLQLENMDGDNSSDEDGDGWTTPVESTPSDSRELPNMNAAPPAPPLPSSATLASSSTTSPSAQATSPPEQSKNPFFRSMGQQPSGPSSSATPSVLSPDADKKVDTNPFHRLTQQDLNKQQALPDPAPAPGRTRSKPVDEDDWSVMDSSDEDDEEEDKPQGGSAKQLASILFGTMAPPRPLSAMDSPASGPGSPAPSAPGRFASPPPAPPLPTGSAPPPPPMPTSGAPPPPPMPIGGAPPPPPMPSMGGPPPPPPPAMPAAPPSGAIGDRSGLLGEIQAGKGLRKVQTKDRSTASTAGRVL